MESSTSSILTRLGGGSGIDTAQLARDLSEVRFAQRIERLQAREELLETRISSAATLRSQLTELASALGDRIRSGDLAAKASIGNSTVAVAGVVTGAVPKGSYSLEVSQLAAAQTLVSPTYGAATDLVGEGTLTFTFGTVDGGSFTADGARDPLAIAVSATDTLSDVADAITASGGGLTAYVASGTNGAQLVIKGATGAANGFQIAGTGASEALLIPAAGNIDYLDWSASSDDGQLRANAVNAEFSLDTVALTSASNTPDNLPGGLTLTLTGTNVGAPTTISFANPTASISTVMGDLVAALNEVAGTLREAADPLNGELGSDPGARRLKRELARLASETIMTNAATGEPSTLGELGLTTNRDGTFSLDNDRLTETLAASPNGAAAMFTTGLFGVFATLDNLARGMATTGDPGSLAGSIARYESQSTRLSDQLADIADKQEALRLQLVTQLARSDRRVTSSQSTLSFLQDQIAAWTNAR